MENLDFEVMRNENEPTAIWPVFLHWLICLCALVKSLLLKVFEVTIVFCLATC